MPTDSDKKLFRKHALSKPVKNKKHDKVSDKESELFKDFMNDTKLITQDKMHHEIVIHKNNKLNIHQNNNTEQSNQNIQHSASHIHADYHSHSNSHTSDTSAQQAPSVSSLENLSYCKSNISKKQFNQLKRGKIRPTETIDLHGLTEKQAKKLLDDFIYKNSQPSNHHPSQHHYSYPDDVHHCIIVIHGKARHEHNHPVIKNAVNQWLRHYPQVLAFSSCIDRDGGTGAVYVLLD